MKPITKMRNNTNILNNCYLSHMARKLDIIWHAFKNKNDENTEVAKVPIINVYDTFLRSKKKD